MQDEVNAFLHVYLDKIAEASIRNPHTKLVDLLDGTLCEAELAGLVATALLTNLEWKTRFDELKADLITDKGDETFLAGRADMAKVLYEIATSKSAADKDKVAAVKEYNLLMGLLKHEEAPDTIVNNVMTVYEQGDGSVDAWEVKATGQQEKVQEDARKSEGGN